MKVKTKLQSSQGKIVKVKIESVMVNRDENNFTNNNEVYSKWKLKQLKEQKG